MMFSLEFFDVTQIGPMYRVTWRTCRACRVAPSFGLSTAHAIFHRIRVFAGVAFGAIDRTNNSRIQ